MTNNILKIITRTREIAENAICDKVDGECTIPDPQRVVVMCDALELAVKAFTRLKDKKTDTNGAHSYRATCTSENALIAIASKLEEGV